MDFGSVIDDIRDWERSNSTHAAKRCPNEDEQSPIVLMQRLFSELSNIAVSIVVATSIANDIDRNSGSAYSADDVLEFCPTYSSIFADTLLKAVDHKSTPGIYFGVMNYVSRFQLAQTLSRRLKLHKSAESHRSAIEIHSDAWRGTCRSLQELLEQSSAYLANLHQDDAVDQGRWIIGLLGKAVAGDSPCLNEHGEIEVPTWAERRRQKRIKVNKPAQISINGTKHDSQILDASRSGVGVMGNGNVGETATVQLPDGRELSGTVEWVRDGRFGLRLQSALSQSDPLLSE